MNARLLPIHGMSNFVSGDELVRQMAKDLDCITEQDFQLLADATPGTVESWRKRGKGPAWLRLGNRVLYPRKAVADYLDSIIKERANVPAKGLL